MKQCAYYTVIEPEELYHELRPCKGRACLCHHPDVGYPSPNGGKEKPFRVAVVDCSAIACALFTEAVDSIDCNSL